MSVKCLRQLAGRVSKEVVFDFWQKMDFVMKYTEFRGISRHYDFKISRNSAKFRGFHAEFREISWREKGEILKSGDSKKA